MGDRAALLLSYGPYWECSLLNRKKNLVWLLKLLKSWNYLSIVSEYVENNTHRNKIHEWVTSRTHSLPPPVPCTTERKLISRYTVIFMAHSGNTGWSPLKILNLIPSEKKNPFPNKITFTSLMDVTCASFGGREHISA